VDAWGSVHRIANCQSTLLDAMGEELAVSPINLSQGDAKEGGQETHPNFHLQGRKERSCVGDHTLDVLPFILEAKRKPGEGSLGIVLGKDTEGLHHTHPFADQLPQPLLLPLGTPNEAAQVPLPSRVVDLKAKALESLAGSGFILCLANVVQLAGLGEVAIWSGHSTMPCQPHLHCHSTTAAGPQGTLHASWTQGASG
jgi:hypothetical protein